MFKMFVTCIVFRIYKYSVIRSNQIAMRIIFFHPRVENLKNTKAFFKKRFPKISNLNDFSAFFSELNIFPTPKSCLKTQHIECFIQLQKVANFLCVKIRIIKLEHFEQATVGFNS